MKRVIGVGGIFFKANDPGKLAAWYKKHLGFDVEDWGGVRFSETLGLSSNQNANRTSSGRHSKRPLIISNRAKSHS